MVAKAIAFEKANAVTDYLNLAISMIPIYNQEHEEVFYAWLNKFEYVMDVIGVPDKKKVKFFNEMIDNNVHNIVKQNYFSVQFSKLSYENIISYYLRYFDSSYKNDLHRKRFMCRNQYEQETIENYANSLRQIYNKCNFEIDQEKVLCEQFVNGIRENDTRIHLNKTPGLSFDEMVTKAIEFDEVNDISNYLKSALSMIPIYNLEYKEAFFAWLNKFEYVSDAVGVPDKKKIIFFNKMVDNDVHVGVKRIFFFVKFSEITYEDIISYYLRYFDSSYKNDLHMKRFMFRNQYEQETIENYANSLRKIYNKCNYAINQEKELCERFVNGISNDNIKIHLNKTPGLSFDEMVTKAIEFDEVNDISDYLNSAISMISIYNLEQEEVFYAWLNKFEYVADVVGVPDKKMVTFFNEMVDNHVHDKVKQYYFPTNFLKLSYEDIINYYLRYFSSSCGNDGNKKRFMCRNQYEQETISKYAENLRKIYNKCNFKNRLKERLCEKFRNGIRNVDIRAHLIRSPRLSLEEAVALSISLEKLFAK
ncbi:hypothetical protein M0804_015241 [Polistes exclamans]|nr:hypothetical protein M0804_015241 [Polistes exclamans]